MHEATLIKNLLDTLEREVVNSQIGNVETIDLEVGQLRYVVPEILNTCFNNIPKSEKLKNAKINLKVLEVKVRCRTCEEKSKVENRDFICTHCNSRNVEIISGDEFILKGITW